MKITYVALEKDSIEQTTEKAFGFFDRWITTVEGFQKANYKWIPQSATIKKDNKIYVNYLIAHQSGIYNYIDLNDKIIIENNKKRTTGKDLILKKLNKELNNRKNQALILYDNKQFEEITFCEEFEYYINNKSKFENYEKYGIIAIFKLDKNNKIINKLIQSDNILNNLTKAQKEYLNVTLEQLQNKG